MSTLQRIIKYLAIAFALFLVVSIASGLFLAVSYLYDDKDETSVTIPPDNSQMQITDINKNFSDLKIELTAVALNIVKGESLSVQTNCGYITVNQENDLLYIKDTRTSFNINSDKSDLLTLTVPDDVKFDEFEIESGAGTVTVGDIAANDISIDLGAGKATFGNVEAYNEACINLGAGKATFSSLTSSGSTSISVGAGDLIINSGTISNADIDLGMGEINFTSSFTGNNEIDVGIGSAKINIPDEQDNYRFDISKGIGNVTINGRSMHDDDKYGSGQNEIEINCGVGDAKINFVNYN